MGSQNDKEKRAEHGLAGKDVGDRMLDNKGFDLWADGYDAAVGLSEEENSYPFAGYKDVLGTIFQEIMSKKNAKVRDLGFGTGTLTSKLYENG